MSLLSLGEMVLWGMLLCFCYQIFLPLTERSNTLLRSVFLYGGAGMLCFLSTALFLYGINGGEWGGYGFVALLLGFFIYHRIFRLRGRRFAKNMVLGGEKALGSFFRLGEKLSAVVAWPFGKIVDKGVLWAEKKTQKEKNNHGDRF